MTALETPAYRTYQASADPKLPVVERMRRSIAVAVEFFDQRRAEIFFSSTRRRNRAWPKPAIGSLRDRGNAASIFSHR